MQRNSTTFTVTTLHFCPTAKRLSYFNQHEKLAIPAEVHGPSSSLLHVTWLTPLKGVSKGYHQGIKWYLFPISTKIDNRFVLDVKLGVDVKNDTHFHV